MAAAHGAKAIDWECSAVPGAFASAPNNASKRSRTPWADRHVGLVTFDSKAVVLDPLGYDRLCELADHRQLVAKIAIQGLEIVRQRDRRIALAVGDGLATINVHQVRRFD